MPNYYSFMMRHGESQVQFVVEQIERREGVKAREGATLEDRWNALLQSSAAQPHAVAA